MSWGEFWDLIAMFVIAGVAVSLVLNIFVSALAAAWDEIQKRRT